MELKEAAELDGFLNDALEVADAEGMPDETALPVWKGTGLEGKATPLTVGALRRLHAALSD